MSENTFSQLKSPKTFEEQLEILRSRNMIIDNDEMAISILKTTNYYRITAYALQYKINDNYNNKISFNDMYNLYCFDNKLKALLVQILEYIEIATRTYTAYTLALTYGADAHLKSEIFKDSKFYYGSCELGVTIPGLITEIQRELNKNKNVLFVKHHNKKYHGIFPTWVIIEVFSFGMLSRMYSNLATKDQKIISREAFSINNSLLESWLSNLSYLRNICAHYGRIYNRRMAVRPIIHTKYNKFNLKDNEIFVSMLAIKELTKNKSEWANFKSSLISLIQEYTDFINLNLMGFPENWEEILNI